MNKFIHLTPIFLDVKLTEIAPFLEIDTENGVTGKDIPELYEMGEFEITYQLFEKLKPLCVHNLKRRYRLDCAILFEGSE